MVYDLGDAVLKVAESDVDEGYACPMSDCRKANRRERDRWEWMKDRPEARGFAAVLACATDGSWMVQEKVASVLEFMPTSLDYDQLQDWYCGAHEEVYGKAYRKFKLNDVHPANIGMTADGRLVVFDYAGWFFKKAW